MGSTSKGLNVLLWNDARHIYEKRGYLAGKTDDRGLTNMKKESNKGANNNGIIEHSRPEILRHVS